MTVNKQELAVAALCNGTVIDHIPSPVLFKVVKILGIQNFDSAVTIGNNLDSKKLGKKGIIKVADVVFPESILNRIALVAPSAVVNIIRDYKVVEKYPVTLPDTLIGLVKCGNPKCITNNEPMLTRFHVVDHNDGTISCHYCSQTVKSADAQII